MMIQIVIQHFFFIVGGKIVISIGYILLNFLENGRWLRPRPRSASVANLI